MATAELLALALRRAPFCIFSKKAPLTLPRYNVEIDFCYFFFSDAMQQQSGLSPCFLTADNRNAKTDFPVDYGAYFEDDAAVCQEYPFPAVKVITEPWITPATTTILETRKTAVLVDSELYMLGCFGPHDDIELGITTLKASFLPSALEPLTHVPAAWYTEAFRQLPLATRLVDAATGTTLRQNDLAETSFLESDTIENCLERLDQLDSTAADYDSYQFGDLLLAGQPARVWIWRPVQDNRSILAISARSRQATIPSSIRAAMKL